MCFGAEYLGSYTEHMARTKTKLMFSGHRRRRRYLVLIGDRQVWLTGGLYESLAQLVHAKMTTGTGFARLSSVVVCRLRSAIEKGCGIHGDEIVESCGGSDYRLAVHEDDICLDDTFFSLEEKHVISSDYFSVFRNRLSTSDFHRD